MQDRIRTDLQAILRGNTDIVAEADVNILKDVLRMLPAGVTVQDEQGRFLFVNDAAAAQLGTTAGNTDALRPKELEQRRETGLEVLRAGHAAVAEESGPGNRVFLTTHRPVRIAERNLLVSSSVDISEQKAVEDQLFRSAYFDELTESADTTRHRTSRQQSVTTGRDSPTFRARVSRHR